MIIDTPSFLAGTRHPAAPNHPLAAKEMLPVGLSRCSTGRWMKQPTRGCCGRSSLPIPISRCSSSSPKLSWAGGPRVRPQDHPRGWAMHCFAPAIIRRLAVHGGSPDNLFRERIHRPPYSTPSSDRLATVLLAEIAQRSWIQGATGRASVRKAPDGTLRVTAVADKGAGRFDTAGDEVAVTHRSPDGILGDLLDEFEEVGRGLAPGASWTMYPCFSASRAGIAGRVISQRDSLTWVPEGYRDAVAPHQLAPDERATVSTFNHQLLEFTSIDPARLRDTHVLSGLLVAAAGAVGMPSLGPPVVREGQEESQWPCSASKATSCCTARHRKAHAWWRSSPGHHRRLEGIDVISRRLGADPAPANHAPARIAAADTAVQLSDVVLVHGANAAADPPGLGGHFR